MVSTLQKKLAGGGKVIIVGAELGSITCHGDDPSLDLYGYRMSKCAAHMGAKSLANDLKKDEVFVGVVHPGMVESQMTAGFELEAGTDSPLGHVYTPEDSAEAIINIKEIIDLNTTGNFYHAHTKEVIPW